MDILGNPVGFHLTPGQSRNLDGADVLLPQTAANTIIADNTLPNLRTATNLGGLSVMTSLSHNLTSDGGSGFLTAAASFVPGVGAEPRVVQRAFTLAPGTTSDTIAVAQGVVWIRTAEKKSADPAAFKAAAPQLEAEMLQSRYAAWVEERKKAVKVEILRSDLRNAPKAVTKTMTLGR